MSEVRNVCARLEFFLGELREDGVPEAVILSALGASFMVMVGSLTNDPVQRAKLLNLTRHIDCLPCGENDVAV
jgi:hypothetical protein